ncbi:hypothetical protein BHE74_00042242 [Ensete ventricosum]|nr:hypothetical protein BHE74_00042242 [Ensete ventricosum]
MNASRGYPHVGTRFMSIALITGLQPTQLVLSAESRFLQLPNPLLATSPIMQLRLN